MEKRKSIVIILTMILCVAVMAGIWFILFPSRPARADEETKQAVEMELEEKDETETGYVPDSDSEKKGGTVKEKVEEKQKDEIIIDEKEWTINGEPIYNRPVIKENLTKDYAPHYHTIGIYEGYAVDLVAYDIGSEQIYEYCDVFDYFINNNVLNWSGSEPSSCSSNNFAFFTCFECEHTPAIALSGEHNFDGNPVIVSGFTVEHCSDCGKNICTDFYKSENPVGNWESAFPLLSEISKVACLFKGSGTVEITLNNLVSGFGSIDWGDGHITSSNSHIYDGFYTVGYLCSIYGLTEIPDEMLADNVYLTSITIPDIVTSIGRNVFDGCENLEKIVFDSATPCEIETDTFDGCDAPIYVPDASVATYKAGWSAYADRIVPKSTLNSSGNGSSGNSNSGSSGTGSGAGGGSSESFLSSVGLDGFSFDGLTDDTDVLGKIIAGVLLF
ncbi:MAG: leucine-rich repeat protein, partial [Clostridia bacterium]|nr:leucine-rich repeat protein [Clostridia bacterium]